MLLDKGLGELMYKPVPLWLVGPGGLSAWVVFLPSRKSRELSYNSLLKVLRALDLAGGSDWWQDFPSTELCSPVAFRALSHPTMNVQQ